MNINSITVTRSTTLAEFPAFFPIYSMESMPKNTDSMFTRKYYSIVMMRTWKLVCGSLLILNLAGCGSKTTTTSVEKTPATPAATVAATDKGSTAAAGFTALQRVVGATTTAIESGKFDVAKTEFAKFEASWKTVEDGVKAKAPDTYQAIEDGVESINSGIEKKQAKDTLISSLQKLSQSIDKARK